MLSPCNKRKIGGDFEFKWRKRRKRHRCNTTIKWNTPKVWEATETTLEEMQPQMIGQEVKSTPPSQLGLENSPSFKSEDKKSMDNGSEDSRTKRD